MTFQSLPNSWSYVEMCNCAPPFFSRDLRVVIARPPRVLSSAVSRTLRAGARFPCYALEELPDRVSPPFRITPLD